MTRIVRGDESRRRRGYDADSPWRPAATRLRAASLCLRGVSATRLRVERPQRPVSARAARVGDAPDAQHQVLAGPELAPDPLVRKLVARRARHARGLGVVRERALEPRYRV